MILRMQHCVQIGCYEMLNTHSIFCLELQDYLHSSNTQLQHNYASVQGTLCLIDLVFDMFRDIGLSMHHNVYMSVKLKADPIFEKADGWNTCVFSKLPSLECVRVDTRITMHNKYCKWLQCLWLITHIHEAEQQRGGPRSGANVNAEDADVYRKSMLFVLQSLEHVYTHVLRNNLSKNDLAENDLAENDLVEDMEKQNTQSI